MNHSEANIKHLLSFTAALWLAAPLFVSHAQPMRPLLPFADTLHALVVFVQFRDDPEPGNPSLAYRGWPLKSTLPTFASDLLAPRPEPPFSDSTLTAYYHQQSLGQFVIYGEVYDSVLVSQHAEARYHRPDGGYGYLTKETLDRIDALGFDFSRFDHNRDGQFDYLFLILRGDTQRDAKRFTWTGISCLDAACGGGPAAGRPTRDLTYDGLTFDWRSSGSILLHRTPGNVLPHRYHVRLMAHELGHDLWRPFFNHIPAITTNDVPQRSNRSPRGTDCIGYALMAGAGGGWDCRGDETISAFERKLLGWIDCTPLITPRSDVVLGDLYTSSDCFTVPLTGDAAGRIVYLSNRQRLGPFDRYRRSTGDGTYEMGLLRTTGLLATLAEGNRFDVLPADNTLDLAPANAPYQGDLFGPGTSRQLTPWTRPNTSGFTDYPAGYEPSWQAIDRIRYTGTADRSMAFDFIADFRTQPVIRADSWIGEETAGFVFQRPITITAGSTLYVQTALTIADQLVLDAGTTLIIAPGAVLTLTPSSVLQMGTGATIQVQGRINLDGFVIPARTARIVPSKGGRIRVAMPD